MSLVWIRVDASETIGRGHLSRCIALADMLKQDFDVRFLMLKANQTYCISLVADWTVRWLSGDDVMTGLLASTDLLVTDSYAIDNAWRKRFQPLVRLLIDVNDLPGEILGANVIINHCPSVTPEMYITDQETTFLLGLDYAILRPEFLAYARSSIKPVAGKGIFISFGGADPFNLGIKAVESLLDAGFTDQIYLVTAKENYRTYRTDQYDNVHILNGLSAEEMRLWMLKSKLLFISSSILCFEAIALRKPIITLYFVDNQRLIYEGLVEREVVKGLGFMAGEDGFQYVSETCIKVFKDETLLTTLERQSAQSIDGYSGTRFISAIINKL